MQHDPPRSPPHSSSTEPETAVGPVPRAYLRHNPRIATSQGTTAELYLRHTAVGDPPADAAIRALAHLPPDRTAGLLTAAITRYPESPPDAPPALSSFFRCLPRHPPAPCNPSDLTAAYRAFHSQSDLFMSALVAATLRNASTLIAHSFHATGRITSNQALARIRHNTHHLYELMLPGSLRPRADGWRLTVRIRLVHAQVRYLLQRSTRWDGSAYGIPLSAAHLALASANFSATILHDAARMGAILSPAARRGYMQLWRYASTIVGVPADLLFDGDEHATLRFSHIAHDCEPSPDERSVSIAHALINALPDMAGETVPRQRAQMVRQTFKVTRALLGRSLADALRFPPSRTLGVLTGMRLERLAQRALHTLDSRRADAWQAQQTAFLLENAVLPRFDYSLPSIPHLTKELPNDGSAP